MQPDPDYPIHRIPDTVLLSIIGICIIISIIIGIINIIIGNSIGIINHHRLNWYYHQLRSFEPYLSICLFMVSYQIFSSLFTSHFDLFVFVYVYVFVFVFVFFFRPYLYIRLFIVSYRIFFSLYVLFRPCFSSSSSYSYRYCYSYSPPALVVELIFKIRFECTSLAG